MIFPSSSPSLSLLLVDVEISPTDLEAIPRSLTHSLARIIKCVSLVGGKDGDGSIQHGRQAYLDRPCSFSLTTGGEDVLKKAGSGYTIPSLSP